MCIDYAIIKLKDEKSYANRNLQRHMIMKDFSKATKIGMIIMIIAGIVMAILVVVSEPVPDLIAWIFFAGLVISIVSTLFVKKR